MEDKNLYKSFVFLDERLILNETGELERLTLNETGELEKISLPTVTFKESTNMFSSAVQFWI